MNQNSRIMKNLKITFIVLMTIIGMNCAAQKASICGKIIGSETAQPVKFATIILYQGDQIISHTESDIDGDYILSSISTGKYMIEISYPGYSAKQITDIDIQERKQQIIIVQLNEGHELKDLEVITYQAASSTSNIYAQGKEISTQPMKYLPVRSSTNLLDKKHELVVSADKQN